MRVKTLSLFILAASALVLSGCDGGRSQMGPKEANLLGVVKHEKAVYTPTGADTFAISTDELYTRRNFSGDKTTLLWGFITLKDY